MLLCVCFIVGFSVVVFVVVGLLFFVVVFLAVGKKKKYTASVLFQVFNNKKCIVDEYIILNLIDIVIN